MTYVKAAESVSFFCNTHAVFVIINERKLPLYCGEWGSLPNVPQEIRLQWYADVREILEKYEIAWANWDYKGGFGVVNRDGEPHHDLLEVLLK